VSIPYHVASRNQTKDRNCGNSYRGHDKGFAFCGQAQGYLETQGLKTKVLAASLTTVEEVMQLAGVHHITVSPPLLTELAATQADGWHGRDLVGRVLSKAEAAHADMLAGVQAVLRDESAWRMAFTRSKAGENERKIIQAINIFADMQDGLEDMAREFQSRA
jgi:transaldolase